MAETIGLPAIAGLAAGIAFVVLFASFMNNNVSTLIEANNDAAKAQSCMTISQIEKIVKFDFKTPSYLPADYQCGRATEGEALVVYWSQPVNREELSNDFGLIIKVLLYNSCRASHR